jgi:uncharacterized membrane protein YbhN (UPF0104 family)
MHHKIKSVSSIFLALGLFFIAYTYLLDSESKSILFDIPLFTHIKSFLFLIAAYLLSGLELQYIYNKTKKINFSLYDTISIPYVINLWGYIIPLQGSFLYFITYLKCKYKTQMKDTSYIYAFVFLVSLSFFGLLGLLFMPFTKLATTEILIVFMGIFLFPVLLILSNYLLKKLSVRLVIFTNIFSTIDYINTNISQLFKDYRTVIVIILFNIAITLVNTFWSYWITIEYNLNVPFSVLFLVSIIMKLSMLFKITPGNLGLNQLANGGVFLLFGYEPSVGVFISTFAYITLFLFSFPLGIVFSIINRKFFSIQDLKSIYKGTKQK